MDQCPHSLKGSGTLLLAVCTSCKQAVWFHGISPQGTVMTLLRWLEPAAMVFAAEPSAVIPSGADFLIALAATVYILLYHL